MIGAVIRGVHERRLVKVKLIPRGSVPTNALNVAMFRIVFCV